MLSFCWVSTSFDILFFNILWTVAQTPIKSSISWKSLVRSFRWVEINCFNRFRFIAEISTNLQKMHYFGQFKDNNSGSIKETRQITPFFLSTFWVLTVCDNHFCISKLPKIHFHGVLLSSILVCKIPEFGGVSCEIRILSHSIRKHTHWGKQKNRFYFFYRVENQISLISWSTFACCRMLFCIGLRLGFWHFKPNFPKMEFSLVATFLLYFWLSFWIEIFSLSHEFLTFTSFNIWR